MSHVHVFATIVAQPGKAAPVRDALVTLAAAARTEPGNTQYVICEDPKQEGHFYTYEVYTDAAGVEAHMKSPHLRAAFAAVGEHLAAQPVITSTKAL